MKALYIHADQMEYEVKKQTPVAEELVEELKKGKASEVLVAFITVEKEDEGKEAQVVEEAAKDLKDVMEKVKAERIMVYPYAHLSPSLASPEVAKKVLKGLAAALADEGIDVKRAPFGWYKAFSISCKGHPLSELSRDFQGKEAAPEKKGEESFIVLLPDGTEIAPEEYKSNNECFMIMMQKEALKKEWPLSGEVKYTRLCKKFGIQWESMSDVGHMCFTSRGALMFDLVGDYSTQIVNSMGLPVYTVKGTNMFSMDEGPVAEHAKLFGDRLYSIETEKRRFVMRYAACHQQFAMMKNWTISYKNLPFGAFEVADSYRLEQSGETMLCFRTRRLNMPDLHVVCQDIPVSEDWFEKLDGRIYQEANNLGRDYEMLVNFSSKEAYAKHKDMLMRLLKTHNKAALLHFYPEGINYYWTVNIEYHILDDMKRAREIGTVQIDVGNAQRFGITFADSEGKKVYPVILHTAIIGTIERWLYTLFDTAVMMEAQGKVGCLPTWVTPEQVRLMSVSESHVARTVELADKIQAAGIRVTVDDRSETVGKKVRAAKQDWVSYAIVIGDKEMSGEKVQVYDRQRNANVEMSVDDLIAKVKDEIKGMPFRPLYMPREMSRQIDL
jgi:threonyl-tRNA synthetase